MKKKYYITQSKIYNSCGKNKGCSTNPYILPAASTKEEFLKLVEEKEKDENIEFNK